MTNRKLRILAVLLAGIVGTTAVHAQTPALLMFDDSIGPIRFAAGDVRTALQANGYSVTLARLSNPSVATQSVRIILTTEDVVIPGKPVIQGLSVQGYAIQRVADNAATNWWVIGKDAPGAMYGGLELAEAVNLANGLAGVTNRQANPYLANRGIKFNIPLDRRTPTYSESGGSGAGMSAHQYNVPEMWNMDFWSRFLDQMARHRYNMLSLWSLSPFPSLVRVPEYPKTALDDVQGWVFTNGSWSVVTYKTMTMDEKIAFWRQVMQYAKDRGIDVYVFTWNIFVLGTENSGYGLTTNPTNAATKDWVRRATRTLFDTYPFLAGIGVTAGENMGGMTDDEKEQWCWETFGMGVQDAMANAQNPASPYYNPNRVIRLVHRAHQTSLGPIVGYFQSLPGYTNDDSTLSFSFKYSQAHMYSSTKPQFIYQNNWFNSIPAGKKTWLTVRNDDMFYLRWGDPDFARAYLTNLPDVSKIAGFYMGPDGYCWGREFVSTEPESPRQLVIDKMWYSFLLWGRLSYDPTLPNSRFQAILGEYFPQLTGANLTDLFTGWAWVSKILPLTTRFYWGPLDFQWYPEACWAQEGFQTVLKFIDPRWDPMQASEDGDRPLLMSVKEYVDGQVANGRLNPEQVADQLQQYADAGLASISGLDPGTPKELRLTLGDIKAMAHLGRYYAEKIRGAVDLYRYQKLGLAGDHINARVHLIAASNHWSQYAAQWSAQYVGQRLIREGSGIVDIAAIQTNVNADIPGQIGPVYTLSTSATNGSITLNPPGGIYSSGVVVSVTAIGNLGYGFSSWGGDLAGVTNNPATILMDTNKSIFANFVPVPTYTLTTSATNGSVLLSPPGGVYNEGAVVTITAVANVGYQFDSWSGDLSGTNNPVTIVMDGNKSVTVNFIVFVGEEVPWIETFLYPDGTKAHGPPTSWTAARASGIFEVRMDRLTINNNGGEGVLETGEIGIRGDGVRASVEVLGQGGLDSSGGNLDYVRFYKVVDGGPEVLIGEILGAVSGTPTLLETNITGTMLKLKIKALVTAADEYYFLDNLKVEYVTPLPSFTLKAVATNGVVTLNPPGGVYTTGAVVTVTATPNSGYSFSHWSGDLSGTNNPATILLDGNKTVTAHFTLLPAAHTVLFVVSDTATNASDTFLANRLPTNFGFAVQFCSVGLLPSDTELTNALGKALILISSTISSASAVAWARRFMTNHLTVPVINWEYGNADEWGFCASGGSGNATSTLLITNAPNGLTAGLGNGVHTVYSAAGNDGTQFTGPNPGVLVAALSPASGGVRIAGLPVGVVINNYSGLGVTVTNASRKVFLGLLGNNQAENLNSNGLALFDAAVRWATGRAALLRFEPPVLEGGQLRLQWQGDGTLQTATNVCGPWDDVPNAPNPCQIPTTNIAEFFRVKQ